MGRQISGRLSHCSAQRTNSRIQAMRTTLPQSFERRRIDSHGFTLLEVLVAILVLSFGMLGVVGLQATALQSNKDARYQSSAVRLGREYAEMMRANKDIAAKAANVYLINGIAAPGASGDCVLSSCSTSAFATYEINEWLRRAQTELPGLRVDVCFDTAPYDGGGLPIWNCTAPAGAISREVPPLYVKIGWTQQIRSTGSSASPFVQLATDRGSRPLVVVPAQLN